MSGKVRHLHRYAVITHEKKLTDSGCQNANDANDATNSSIFVNRNKIIFMVTAVTLKYVVKPKPRRKLYLMSLFF